MMQELSLDALRRIAHGLALQFGSNCEVVVHSLADCDIDHSIVAIENGHVTGRKLGDGPSHVVLEALQQGDAVSDHLGYLTRTKDGKILKSSTIYLRGADGHLQYILAINFDITGLLMFDSSLSRCSPPPMSPSRRNLSASCRASANCSTSSSNSPPALSANRSP